MGRNKLQRFVENDNNDKVLQEGKPLFETIKGKWHSEFFGNPAPITLELACGRGEYSVGLAAVYPERNFIGIDIKGARIWKGSRNATAQGLANVGFLRTKIENLTEFFAENEVNEIWIVHPDPRPRDRDEKRRLTSHRFLEIYRKIITKNGIIHFKTDNLPLFDYSLEVLAAEKNISELVFTHDLYDSPLLSEHHGIVTNYEKIFSEKGHKINYLRFRID